MDNGNTAVSISPVPSEDEMSGIRQIFERAANAIVQASELARQVTDLQAKFDKLNGDMEYILSRNQELITSLNEVRGQRDTAMRERDEANNQIHSQGNTITQLQETNTYQAGVINDLRAKLEAMTNDRDIALDEWHKADEAKALAEGKLADIEAHMAKAFGLARPEPTHTPVNVPIEDHGPSTGEEIALTHLSDAGPANPPLPEPWKHD